ncbi:histidine kinase [Ferruginibacter sp. HRS2-29]|uniref:tetratricopeptide repeat-containing sensor histidine kinase n=1 Tax=Ferruginibacter sp. HRS2-29 TaxID=2487334 RepID=UPI0020CFB872|nr:histidine kinase [Ferruginibacter sp. HRS2-29]
MFSQRVRKTTKTTLFFLFSFFCNHQLFAQAIDTSEIKTNIQVCVDSIATNPQFAKSLAGRMLQASKDIKYPWGIFMNTMVIGTVSCNAGDYKEAIRLHEYALGYCRANKFRHKESVVLANIGKDYNLSGDHRKSIGFYQQALVVAQDIRDTVQMAQALEGMGEMYNRMGYHAETVRYCGEAVVLFKLKNRYNSARIAYNNIGASYIQAKKYDSASKYIWLSQYEFEKASPGAPPPADFYLNLALCYDSLGKKDSATYCYKKAVEICEETGDEVSSQAALYYLGVASERKGKIAEARKYYKQSLKFCEKYNNLEGIIEVTNSLATSYASTGDYANAYAYGVKASEASDSLLGREKVQAIAELNARFDNQQLKNEFDRKTLLSKVEQEKKLARRNILLYTFISIAALLLAGIFFVVKYFRQKAIINANRNNELKQRLLLTQMNPHFIFNSVDNIQSLIHANKDEEAISYLTKFSKLTRQILENSRENYITLSEELNMLDNYMTIQKLLYNNNFAHTVKVDDNIDPETVLLPPMLTQPFIENAIRHGLKDRKEGGMVNVRFYLNEGQLFFEVTDNGVGMIVKEKEKAQRSLSTQITKERLESIASKKNIIIQTLNITGNDNMIHGVKTFFEIPYIYNN